MDEDDWNPEPTELGGSVVHKRLFSIYYHRGREVGLAYPVTYRGRENAGLTHFNITPHIVGAPLGYEVIISEAVLLPGQEIALDSEEVDDWLMLLRNAEAKRAIIPDFFFALRSVMSIQYRDDPIFPEWLPERIEGEHDALFMLRTMHRLGNPHSSFGTRYVVLASPPVGINDSTQAVRQKLLGREVIDLHDLEWKMVDQNVEAA